MAEPRPDRKLRDATYLDGIEVKPVYGPADVAGLDYRRDLGDPGQYPFTRGIHPHMYRARVWTMRQYIGFGTPAETNARFKYLMAHGQDALNVAFDLPTQLGLDSDDPRGRRARSGASAWRSTRSLDMEEAFDGIAADRVSISFTINSMAALHPGDVSRRGGEAGRRVGPGGHDAAERHPQGVRRAAEPGCIRWSPSLRLVCDIAEFCARHAPKVNPISVCGYHIREAGCTPAQEMAYGLLIVAAYADLLAQARPARRRASRRACRSTSRAGGGCSRRSRSSAPAAGCTPA